MSLRSMSKIKANKDVGNSTRKATKATINKKEIARDDESYMKFSTFISFQQLNIKVNFQI